MKLRVGVVGVDDSWQQRYRQALRSLSDRFEVRAVYSDVAQRAEMAARDFAAAPVDGYRALAGRDDIEAVLVLSSSWCGVMPILAACDAGKAVYCASALDIASDRLADVRQRIQDAGVAFMAELPRRHAPATLRLKELMATRLGAPQMLFCHRRLTVAPVDPSSSAVWAVASRELIELVDWCRYVVGADVDSVMGVRHLASGAAAPDYEMMSLAFGRERDSATIAQISCGQYMPAAWHEAISFRPPSALQVACERGIAFVDLPSTLTWFDDAGRHMESLESERPVCEQMLLQFHRAVTSLVRKTHDLEDAYRAVQVVLAARQSHAAGRRIELT